MTYSNSAIRSKVETLLTELNLNRLPIDLDKITDSLGLNVFEEDLEDELSGFLIVKNRIPSIAINSTHHNHRQRFTLAHEIGHYCLHINDGTEEDLFVDKKVFHRDKEASRGEVRMEIEANKFAAELLMPKSLIEDLLGGEFSDIDLEDDEAIENMAKRFEVSTQALAYRLGNLGVISKY